jgi:hypothetical protein
LSDLRPLLRRGLGRPVYNFVFPSLNDPLNPSRHCDPPNGGEARSGLGRPKKNPPFWRRVFVYRCYYFILYAPPPVKEDIIMTTTIIIIEVMAGITLYTLFFNIRVYALRIYTHRPRKELWQAIIF